MEINNIYCGDCVKLAQEINDNSIQMVVCSPPYAMQRAALYGGIAEQDYPQWTVTWMESLRPKLSEDGSIFIVIRENIRNGEISDYVLRTRLAIRDAGWIEPETIIWHKPDAPPLGNNKRPRRVWEYILWYSQSRSPYCDLKACGNKKSTRVGGFAGSDRFGEGGSSPIAANQHRELTSGTSRISDLLTVTISSMDRGIKHPAMYPRGVPNFLIQTFSEPGDLVLDPFCGSGQTCLEAAGLGRKFLGFDLKEEYVSLTKQRLADF